MGKTTRKTTEEYKKLLKEKHSGKIICLGEYVNNSTKILHKCLEHNYEYYSTPNCVLTSKHGCPKCGEDAHKKHTNSMRKIKQLNRKRVRRYFSIYV